MQQFFLYTKIPFMAYQHFMKLHLNSNNVTNLRFFINDVKWHFKTKSMSPSLKQLSALYFPFLSINYLKPVLNQWKWIQVNLQTCQKACKTLPVLWIYATCRSYCFPKLILLISVAFSGHASYFFTFLSS